MVACSIGHKIWREFAPPPRFVPCKAKVKFIWKQVLVADTSKCPQAKQSLLEQDPTLDNCANHQSVDSEENGVSVASGWHKLFQAYIRLVRTNRIYEDQEFS